ncbi:hypothetical protein RU86_GL001599 [Lactococcus piscium]|uniref:ESAT-6-like protein n=2 Tax=Pseudolactococcus piscium TaxID=1364 RepID=A0A2A5S534_9LACT|nr:hypothetical protein RU86_GL001599 [Lactococcus piscium]
MEAKVIIMAQISVTPEELKEQAQVYVRSKEDIELAIQNVNRMNDTIAQEWKGAAFEAYLEQYNQLYVNVQKFEDLLADINQQLTRYADTIAERDAQDAQSFGF